jgi:hypothetical protein
MQQLNKKPAFTGFVKLLRAYGFHIPLSVTHVSTDFPLLNMCAYTYFMMLGGHFSGSTARTNGCTKCYKQGNDY